MEQARGVWAQEPDEVWANVLNTRTPHRRILDRAGGMGCAMDRARDLEGVLVEGVATAVAEAGATTAATGRMLTPIQDPARMN